MTVRVRFAPSPTGFLHVGGARSALYNWLFARGRGGTFILRSDDTDRARSTSEFAADIVEGMRWLGLDWDEGIEVGGPHGTYRQSDRLDRYRDVARGLLERHEAYPCFCTPEDLEDRRRRAMAEGRSPGYDGRCRAVPPADATRRREAGEPASIRLAVPRPGETVVEDLVRGAVRFDHEAIDDFVILRSGGMPTYHLASAVDDVDFEITHVVRGEDLLSSTPKHMLIGRALGVPDIVYAHLSLLHGPDGRKLSKRHGHTSLRAYREAGFLPEAMINYLALLGWSPGEDETIVALSEMVERFDLGAVSRNPAVFDVRKLEWMNGVYIRDLSGPDFAARALPFVRAGLGRALEEAELEVFAGIAPLVQERAKRLDEVADQVRFLFVPEVEYDETSWRKVMERPDAPGAIAAAVARLEEVEGWTTEGIEAALRAMLDDLGLSARKGLQPLRVAVTGSQVSPPLFESLAALGRERTLERLRRASGRRGGAEAGG
jgi:glutamyl-tRNA synthetase